MLDVLWNLASFVIALGILVTVHEYGHYWVAIKNGVKVERFSVGFGRPIWRKRNKAGTEFVLALIPLGGYVRMLDERVDEVAPHEKSQAFNNKTVLQRIAIIAAGPLANFAFAVVAFYLMFLLGLPGIKPVVKHTVEQSIAAKANLPASFEIVAINDEETTSWQSVNLALVRAIGDSNVIIYGKSSDSTSIQKVNLDTSQWQFEPNETTAIASLGIVPFQPEISPVVAYVAEGSAAEKAQLQVGDELITVDAANINGRWQTLVDVIRTKPNSEVTVEVMRDGQIVSLWLTPDSRELPNGEIIGYAGVSPTVAPWPEEYRTELSYGPIDAAVKGVERTWQMITLSFDMIAKLITGDVSVKNISGPIGIAQSAGHSAGYGLVYFLSFLALISINLGIINLLPLPVLDGGHLLYYFIEFLTGKPVPEQVQEVGFRIGAMVLFLLMSVAIFNDLSRLS